MHTVAQLLQPAAWQDGQPAPQGSTALARPRAGVHNKSGKWFTWEVGSRAGMAWETPRWQSHDRGHAMSTVPVTCLCLLSPYLLVPPLFHAVLTMILPAQMPNAAAASTH